MSLSWAFLVSFALVLAGMVVMMIAFFSEGYGQGGGGAVILIGPIPIILGSGPDSTWLILLASVITMIAFALLLLTRRKIRS